MNQACGIILAAHGSRRPGAMEALTVFRDRVAARYPLATVAIARTVGRKHGNAAAFGGARQVDDILAALRADGIDRVAVQSLHVAPGEEYHELLAGLGRWLQVGGGGAALSVGAPLLADLADVDRAAAAVLASLPERSPDEAVVLMGHGAPPPGAGFYEALRERLARRDPDVYFGAMPRERGAPGLDIGHIRDALVRRGLKKAWLMPFFTVAGSHACSDLAGERPDSWRGQLETAGVACRSQLAGLIEIEPFAAVWADHLDRAMARLG